MEEVYVTGMSHSSLHGCIDGVFWSKWLILNI